MKSRPLRITASDLPGQSLFFLFPWQKTKFDVFVSPLRINTIPDSFVVPEQPAQYPLSRNNADYRQQACR
jgi:hypothetical protein